VVTKAKPQQNNSIIYFVFVAEQFVFTQYFFNPFILFPLPIKVISHLCCGPPILLCNQQKSFVFSAEQTVLLDQFGANLFAYLFSELNSGCI
jgi:hypothetical protein